jgi:alpha-tubulin suppressor-like RCC1 family protein
VSLASPADALASSSVAVTVGFEHACSLTSAGGVQCWGGNASGQLGDGTMTNSMKPVDVSGLSSGVVAISAGFKYTCALTSKGAVECWGENSYGELGIPRGSSPETCRYGGEPCSTTPVAVSGLGSGVTAISAVSATSCALTSAGAVECWGLNNFGQLGNGTSKGPEACEEINTCDGTPGEVSGLGKGVVAISGTCALTSAGPVKCWGSNTYGQLGDGSSVGPEECYVTRRACSTTPVEVAGSLGGPTAISSSFYHSCALTSLGGVKCWGANLGGALGVGTITGPEECQSGACSTTPVEVSGLGSGITESSVGEVDSCALTSVGGALCWGANAYGAVGDGTTELKTTPVAVKNLSTGVVSNRTGGQSSCALTNTGAVKCWGRDNVGQLGGNATQTCINRSPCSPIPVHANGLAATCAANSGKVTLEPGLSGTAAVQTMKISGSLKGCTGEPFTEAKYTATLKTAGPVSCAVLKEGAEPASGSAKYTWTPKVKASLASLSMSLGEASGIAFIGETTSGSYSPVGVSGSVAEAYKGASKCGIETLKKGTFSGSGVTFE